MTFTSLFFTARILLNFHRKCDNFVADKPRLTYFFLNLNTTLSNASQCKGAQSLALLLILKTDYQRRPIFSRFAKKKKMVTRCRDRKSESFYPQTLFALYSQP